MKPFRLAGLVLITASSAVLAQPAPPDVRSCATPEPPAEEVLRSSEQARPFISQSAYFRVERVKFLVPVEFHVIHANGIGNVTDQQLDAQIRVLNDKLGPLGYQFVKRSTKRHDRPDWHIMLAQTASELTPKTELAGDHRTVLNFYIAVPQHVDRETQEIVTDLGYATLPWYLEVQGWDTKLEGVVIHYDSLPGAPPGKFDLGHTAVHEVGHWLGLLHTFNGGGALAMSDDGCEPPGDEVGDTPYEHTSYFGPGVGHACAEPPISACPGAGRSPIRNYMDYADDRCMTEWTPGQDLRARSLMQRYRPTFVERSPDVMKFRKMQLGN